MAFFNGNIDMVNLIDLWCDQLIASGNWVDADPTGRPVGTGQRAIRHATDTPNVFVVFDRRVQTTPMDGAFNEIRVEVASGYDTGTSTSSGTIQVSGMATEIWHHANGTNYHNHNSYRWNAGGNTGSGNKAGQHWTWIDGEGFTSIFVPESGGGIDVTCHFTMDRISTKEYSDGYTNVFLLSQLNTDATFNHSNSFSNTLGQRTSSNYFGFSTQNNHNSNGDAAEYDAGRAAYCRPFNFQSSSRNGIQEFFSAYKSVGNSKVYLQFPFYNNNESTTQRIPISQTQKWFRTGQNVGMADGDIIEVVVGGSTLEYLVKEVQSPDSTAYILVAIRFGP